MDEIVVIRVVKVRVYNYLEQTYAETARHFLLTAVTRQKQTNRPSKCFFYTKKCMVELMARFFIK